MAAPATAARRSSSITQAGTTPAAKAAAATVPDAEPYRSFAALTASMEALAAAVVRHDARAVETATTEAAELVARIERLAADGLEPPDPPVDGRLLDDLADRLAESARLAAQLIERAWSSEAATLHLLARCLGGARSGEPYRSHGAGKFPSAGSPLVVERRA